VTEFLAATKEKFKWNLVIIPIKQGEAVETDESSSSDSSQESEMSSDFDIYENESFKSLNTVREKQK
jgi:hypothetical protein